MVIQRMTSPSLYLDTCALQHIALDSNLAERSRATMLTQNGSLALSWLHFMELCDLPAEKSHKADAVASFLDSLYPHLWFIEVNYGQVVQREDENRKGPQLDNGAWPQQFVCTQRRTLHPMTFTEVIESCRRDPAIARRFKTSLCELNSDLERARLAYQQNPRALRHPDDFSERLPNHPPTRLIAFEMWQHVMKSRTRTMRSNDWRDFAHMVVPLAYCDFLVLDRGWAATASRISDRLRRKPAELARVFSMRELNDFVQTLENAQVDRPSTSKGSRTVFSTIR